MHSTCIRSSKSEYNKKLIDGHAVKQIHDQSLLNVLLFLIICVQSTVICLSDRSHSTSFINNDQLELVEHGPQHIPVTKNDVYMNSFHVHLHDHHKDNGEHVAKRLAKRHGFTNLGKVSVLFNIFVIFSF